MIKYCGICGKLFETIEFGGARQYCFDCVPLGLDASQRTTFKRRAAKDWAVKFLGGKCEKCGETRPHILAFHHLEGKDGSPANLLANSKIKEFFTEVFKSILLCNNCHGDFHYLNTTTGITLEEYLGREIPHYVDTRSNFILPNIEEPKKEMVKSNKPSAEELEKILLENNGNFSKVGKIFGISDNGVRKWCKMYNMPFHSADYKNQ